MLRSRPTTPAAILLAVGLAASASHAQVRSWNNAAGGNWSLAGNWAGADVPNTIGESAEFSLAGSYSVGVDAVFNVASIAVLNPSVTLNLNTGRVLTLNSASTNNGLLVINTTAGASDAILSIASDLTLAGSGVIQLNGIGSDATIGGLGRLTLPTTAAINGSGLISAPLTNNGLVQAIPLAAGRNTITLSNGAKTNNGTIRADNGAVIAFSGITVDQTGGGTIVALPGATGGTVTLSNTTINSGTLATTAPGLISTSGVATLTGVTLNSGLFNHNSGHVVTINGAGLTNNATYDINPTGGASDASLNFSVSGNLDGTGIVRMRSGSTDSTLSTSTGQTLTHASTHTIAGVGNITATLINNGVIRADEALSTSAASTLTLTSGVKANNNRIEVTDGSTLSLSVVTIDQTAGGVIEAFDGPTGAVISLNAATVLGGQIATSGNALTTTAGVATLNSVTLTSGTFNHNTGTTVTIQGTGLTNHAEYNINPSGGASDAAMTFNTTGALAGTGTVRMRSGSTNSTLASTVGQTVTHAATHTIEGVGTLSAALINNGTVAADASLAADATNTLTLSSNAKTNNNLFVARPASELILSAITVTNSSGTIRAEDTGTVRLSAGSVTGGTIESLGSGQVILSNTTLNTLTLDATSSIPSGSSATIGGTITHDGLITVNPTAGSSDASLRITADTTLTGSGEVYLNAGSTDSNLSASPSTAVLTQGPNHTLTGRGLIAARLSNNGTISPGDPAFNQTDFLTFTQPLNLAGTAGTGNLFIQIEGAGILNYDRLVGTGGTDSVTLGGALTVQLINAYSPAIGDTFDIISGAASVTGDFATLDLPGTSSGFVWRTFILSNGYRLVFTCLADLTGDGVIDSGDLGAFITAFLANDPSADVTNDNQVDSGDLATFVTLFLAGSCPTP
jgi:hypothetical protein